MLLQMTSLKKGLDFLQGLRSEVAELDRKVASLSAWKHAHIAEQANLKLSFDQHVAWYEQHMMDYKRNLTR